MRENTGQTLSPLPSLCQAEGGHCRDTSCMGQLQDNSQQMQNCRPQSGQTDEMTNISACTDAPFKSQNTTMCLSGVVNAAARK